MAIGDPYATLDDLKDYLGIEPTKTRLDGAMISALTSASAEIERVCQRQFNQQTVATPRIYEPFSVRVTWVDDFWTTAGLVVQTDPGGIGVFSDTWTTPEYELYPLNNTVDGQTGWPYSKVRAAAGRWFPKYVDMPYRRTGVVQITAQWGWPAVPPPVHQACLIMAASTLEMKKAPLGVGGVTQFGAPIRIRDNPMAASKLARYIKDPVRVA